MVRQLYAERHDEGDTQSLSLGLIAQTLTKHSYLSNRIWMGCFRIKWFVHIRVHGRVLKPLERIHTDQNCAHEVVGAQVLRIGPFPQIVQDTRLMDMEQRGHVRDHLGIWRAHLRKALRMQSRESRQMKIKEVIIDVMHATDNTDVSSGLHAPDQSR